MKTLMPRTLIMNGCQKGAPTPMASIHHRPNRASFLKFASRRGEVIMERSGSVSTSLALSGCRLRIVRPNSPRQPARMNRNR
ncbi:MAG: hypothetical protein BWX47_02129 [candidate division Hyd24-12 bacterium ADurb.Bin004]|nr:MAG: hypothetical protein BWX47_02129 [candidate division Hyd24-12 bacterium ADurb.Bin004]